MSYKAGGIEYDIEMDTSDMISAGDDVEKKLSEMQSSFAKADKMVKDFEKSIRSSGGSISKHGVVLDKHGNEVTKDTKRLKMLTSQVDTLNRKMKGSKGNFGAVGSSAQQAGYQIGDFATQVASGQNALVAFTQQGTQFVSMFGPGGAIAGSILAIGGAIGVALLPNLFKSEKSIDENREKAKELAQQYGYSKEAVAAYQRATERKIEKEEQDIAKTEEKIKKIKEQIEAQKGLTGSLIDNALPEGLGLQSLADWVTGVDIQSVAKQIDAKKAKTEMDNLIISLANSKATLEDLKKENGAVGEIPKIQKEFQEDLNKAIQMQNALMNGGELQAKKLAAAFQLNLTNAEMLPPEIEKSIEKLHRLEEVAGRPSLVDALKEQFVAQSKLRAELKMSTEDADVFQARMTLGAQASQDEIDKLAEEIKAVNILKETLAQSKAAASFVESGKYDDPTEKLNEQFEKEQELLQVALENKFIAQEEYEQRLTNMKEHYEERRFNLSKDYNQQLLNSYSNLAGSVSGAFGAIAGAMKESEGEQSSSYKTMFALAKGFAVAQSGINLWLAISQAMADPSALTLPQKLANYAAVAAAMGGVITSLASVSYGGGRQYGGPVSPNTMYEVNETGVPEIVSAGGKDYMTMGTQGGKVTPLDKMGMGGGVTVNNYGSPDLVEVKQVDRGWVIEVARKEAQRAKREAVSDVAEQFRSNKGQVYNAASQNGNYRGRAGTGR